jgi:hypothetical protein
MNVPYSQELIAVLLALSYNATALWLASRCSQRFVSDGLFAPGRAQPDHLIQEFEE